MMFVSARRCACGDYEIEHNLMGECINCNCTSYTHGQCTPAKVEQPKVTSEEVLNAILKKRHLVEGLYLTSKCELLAENCDLYLQTLAESPKDYDMLIVCAEAILDTLKDIPVTLDTPEIAVYRRKYNRTYTLAVLKYKTYRLLKKMFPRKLSRR